MSAAGVTIAVAETVRELGRVPAGVIYSGLMTEGVTMEQYEAIEGALVRTRLVKRVGDELVWIGPRFRS